MIWKVEKVLRRKRSPMPDSPTMRWILSRSFRSSSALRSASSLALRSVSAFSKAATASGQVQRSGPYGAHQIRSPKGKPLVWRGAPQNSQATGFGVPGRSATAGSLLRIQLVPPSPASVVEVVCCLEALRVVAAGVGCVAAFRISPIFCICRHLLELVVPLAAVQPCGRVRYVAAVVSAPLFAPLLSVHGLHDLLVQLGVRPQPFPCLEGVLFGDFLRVGAPELCKLDLDGVLFALVSPLVRGGRGSSTICTLIYSTLVYSACGFLAAFLRLTAGRLLVVCVFSCGCCGRVTPTLRSLFFGLPLVDQFAGVLVPVVDLELAVLVFVQPAGPDQRRGQLFGVSFILSSPGDHAVGDAVELARGSIVEAP
ncbi:hypothetical protein 2209_scaffold441_00056 [Bacteriophage sp.]|nr:hypothetical protein 2209_scaffold441_00056 [Bacteriophage sp.]